MSRLFTPDEYVLFTASQFPSLYACDTFEQTAFRVYDQLFNVLGNGLNDKEAVLEELTFVEFNQEEAKRFITAETLYYGWYETRTWFGDTELGEGDPITVLEQDKPKYPAIKLWVESSQHEYSPCPNFKETYSMVYKDFFAELGDDWVKAASWFYTECKKYFDGDHSSYSRAYPKKDAFDNKEHLTDYEDAFKKYASHEAIAEAYDIKFNGDIDDFAKHHWQKELSRIYAFLDATQERLSGMLNEQTVEPR